MLAKVLRPPSIENDEVSGLRFVLGLRFRLDDPDPTVPPALLGPFPPVPAIGMGSVAFSATLAPSAVAVADGVVLRPIDMPNPFPLASASLVGSLTDTTASFEGYTGGADGGCSTAWAATVGFPVAACGVVLAEFPANGFGVELTVVFAEYTRV